MRIHFILISLFFSVQALAAPATSYNCVGYNSADAESIIFNLVLSNQSPYQGFTYQAIELKKLGSQELGAPIVLNLNGIKDCEADQDGYIGFAHAHFNMLPALEDSFADYIVSFRANCGQELDFDVRAYCFFENQPAR